MKIKVLFCNCTGLTMEPELLNMDTLSQELEGDVDVQYALKHPQLCGKGGIALLTDLLRGSDKDNYVLVAGCGPELQPEYMGHVFRSTGFPPDRYIPIDVRGKDNEGARAAVLETVGRLMARKGEGSFAVYGFGG